MSPTQPIETPEQLIAILGDPRRMRILEILTKQQASVKDLAVMIHETPQATHYHTKQLEKVGLIRIVETREVKGILEKFYRAVAERFVLSKAIGEQLRIRGMETWVRLLQEFAKLTEYYSESDEDRVEWATVDLVVSDKKTMVALQRRLKKLEQDFKASNREGPGPRYVLALGLFSTDPNIALPEDPTSLLGMAEGGPELDFG